MRRGVLAVHDVSGVGRCSLTVALPIISVAGVECSVLPTAVLSTHTGGFSGYVVRDLTDDIQPTIRQWVSLELKFRAIYTGYLGSLRQTGMMTELFRTFADDETLIAVDPVMGDNGKLYAAFDMSFVPAMREVCKGAGLIMPNMTEAALLLGREYQPGPYTEKYIRDVIVRLASLLPVKSIVLTGVYFDSSLLGAASWSRESGAIDYIFSENVPGTFHGTGDVFGSALVAALTVGKPMNEAVRASVDFTAASIRRTAKAGTEIRYGVDFEPELPGFMRSLGIMS